MCVLSSDIIPVSAGVLRGYRVHVLLNIKDALARRDLVSKMQKFCFWSNTDSYFDVKYESVLRREVRVCVAPGDESVHLQVQLWAAARLQI